VHVDLYGKVVIENLERENMKIKEMLTEISI